MSDAGVIHDIGYQRYEGPRLGRAAVFGALYQHGLRASFGLGRSIKAKIFPWLVVGIVLLVAVINAAARAQFDVILFDYFEFDDTMSWLIIFFVAIVAPELMSRDMRAGVLPLYFSRPLRASDYVGAKVASLITAVFLLLGVPQFIMFLTAAFTLDGGISKVWEEFYGALLPGWAYSLLWAVLFASISLLVASLTGKRAFAAGGIVAFFLMTAPVVAVLTILPSETAQDLAGLASPMSLISGVQIWLRDGVDLGLDVGRFGPIYGIEAFCLVAAALLLLLARYRKVAAL
ncbi:ABC transporter permease [Paractinoplanes atraurantiacus]|uniref:ABC-2 type transport system permease protein n=1 Tax=Paractinoplanes atraurantiacus TaxID=1036182 RepID=A0A285IUW1_9ACTN|nr:ABC transporter permease [Actinoplanes atraurantiacus]SNY51623.1 ABC-2 type transport system permease protein [Actinoplanes atraurantiacus]